MFYAALDVSQAAADDVQDEPGQVIVREAVEPGSADDCTFFFWHSA